MVYIKYEDDTKRWFVKLSRVGNNNINKCFYFHTSHTLVILKFLLSIFFFFNFFVLFNTANFLETRHTESHLTSNNLPPTEVLNLTPIIYTSYWRVKYEVQSTKQQTRTDNFMDPSECSFDVSGLANTSTTDITLASRGLEGSWQTARFRARVSPQSLRIPQSSLETSLSK